MLIICNEISNPFLLLSFRLNCRNLLRKYLSSNEPQEKYIYNIVFKKQSLSTLHKGCP
jgi:hypothetical protein